jgi:hypothetical protein
MSNFIDYRDRVGSNPDKQFKATLFQSGRLMLGLNCLEPGQSQHAHTHADQDKFYFVARTVSPTPARLASCCLWESLRLAPSLN